MRPDKPDFQPLAKELFELHTNTDVFHFTADSNAFKIEHEAYNHSLKLKDQTVTEIYRPGITAAEIKTLKLQLEKDLQQGAKTAYRGAFPEMARSIDYNKNAKLHY